MSSSANTPKHGETHSITRCSLSIATIKIKHWILVLACYFLLQYWIQTKRLDTVRDQIGFLASKLHWVRKCWTQTPKIPLPKSTHRLGNKLRQRGHFGTNKTPTWHRGMIQGMYQAGNQNRHVSKNAKYRNESPKIIDSLHKLLYESKGHEYRIMCNNLKHSVK